MDTTSPLFDKAHRARFAQKLDALLGIATSLGSISVEGHQDALLAAIPRLYRRAATIVGVYGFGLEAQRIDGLLQSRQATLLQTRDGKSVDAIVDLAQLLEDLQFLVADDIHKLPPLVTPTMPKPILNAKPPAPKPAPKPIPTLKLPTKKSKR